MPRFTKKWLIPRPKVLGVERSSGTWEVLPFKRRVIGLPSGGPWDTEADVCIRKYKGVILFVRRGPLRALNGYVGVPFAVPEEKSSELEVHGGITYQSSGPPCSVDVHPFLDVKKYSSWLGFDCAHLGDLIPLYSSTHGDIYRDMTYVQAETESLADQLIALEKVKHDKTVG
jgi:hypothetical protein